MELERKYGEAVTLYGIPLIIFGSTKFAATGDYTPAAGDVKIKKDSGAWANIGTLPAPVGNGWNFVLTATEMEAKEINIQVVDAADDEVEDQEIRVVTYGHASALHLFNRDQSVPQVDLLQIASDAQSATDLKDFADAGYDPGTNKVEGVKLVDVTTENTDMVDAAPTVGEIDTELTANHGSGSWQSVAGTAGVGAVTVTILDQFAAPVIGAKVTITDVVGSGNYSGGGTTDGDGEVVIDALATGTYTIVSTANGYEIPNTLVTIGAVAQDVDITADKSTVNAPVDPSLGTLYGDMVKITGADCPNVEVFAVKTSEDVVFSNSAGVTKYKRSTLTDADGRFTFELLLDVELTITVPQLNYEEDITLTAATTNLEDAT